MPSPIPSNMTRAYLCAVWTPSCGPFQSIHELDRLYLKMDTQGFDLEVVRGAPAVLPTVRALQTEASILPLYQGMPSWITAVETLQGLGFEISGFFPVSTDPNMRLIEVDCVMVNRTRNQECCYGSPRIRAAIHSPRQASITSGIATGHAARRGYENKMRAPGSNQFTGRSVGKLERG